MARQWDVPVRVFNRPATPVIDHGVPVDAYVFVHSGEPDGAFLMSRGVPAGRDSIIAGQRDFKADAVYCCDDETPVRDDSVLQDLDDDRIYRVRARDHAKRTSEFVLICEHASGDTGATVNLVGAP